MSKFQYIHIWNTNFRLVVGGVKVRLVVGRGGGSGDTMDIAAVPISWTKIAWHPLPLTNPLTPQKISNKTIHWPSLMYSGWI